MGTRGTLKVYLNGKLKINQYNQWDSYPTGQFMDICRFLASKYNRECLVNALETTAFLNKDAVELYRGDIRLIGNDERTAYIYSMALCNRDIGANILYLLAFSPRLYDPPRGLLAQGSPDKVNHVLVNWDDVFDGGLDLQEGNYELYLNKDDKGIRFQLVGNWHGKERDYRNTLPSKEEIEEWAKEGA